MKDSVFTIYSASAGSGKTYTLTKNYLKLLFEDHSLGKFKQILALTFTNKAVAEMKSRILESLYSFSKKEILQSNNSLFHDLCDETGTTPEALHRKSTFLLRHILHNYSFFDVSTIDKFNHRILKTFSRDLQLSQSFEVELDLDSLLEKAVEKLLDRAGSDKELTQTLIAFSLEKIDDYKSWNIAYDLVDIGKLLFQENHSVHLKKLEQKSISDFNHLKTKLRERIAKHEQFALVRSNLVLKKIIENGFSYEDFPRQTLPNHFKKISNSEYAVKKLYNNKLEQQLLENKILRANDSRDTSSVSEFILKEFRDIKKSLYQRAYLSNIYGNVVPMTLLNEISKEIKNIELEQDLIPISELNQIISKEIKGQPVPFIYERLGEKYRHYFIDEFQDTSQVQWENLVPLISNALESENEQSHPGSLFLVGDVKQAIYRWRGGKAEQLLNLFNKTSNPFTVNPETKVLSTNWRSASEIVLFNNDFFSMVAPILQNKEYEELYLQGNHQKINENVGGYIKLSFIGNEKTDRESEYCKEVLIAIQEVRSKNYPFSDICILVRENKKGAVLADFLSEKGIPLISPDSLLLKNHHGILFLVALLTYLTNADDRTARFEILRFLAKGDKKRYKEEHDFVVSHLENLSNLLETDYGFSVILNKNRPVFDIMEAAITAFDLTENNEAYLTFFMDLVLEVEKKEGPDISSFLEYWSKKKETLSLTAPEGVDAVQIMTIHKAKGLEFPFVIFPFADSPIQNVRNKKIWVPQNHENDWDIDDLLINYSKEIELYDENAKNVYVDEQQKTQMDALNLLYVALTRAKTGLFVVSEKSKSSLNLEELSSYSDLFAYYLKCKGLQVPEKLHYSFGSIQKNENFESKAGNINIPYILSAKNKTGLAISTKSGQLWGTKAEKAIEIGNLVHFALGKIFYSGQVSTVLNELEASGELTEETFEKTRNLVNNTVDHPLIKEYFSKDYTIYNEREILNQDGKVLRPDRVAIKNNTATIIDYKTGKTSPTHKSQMESYCSAIKNMGYSIKNPIIVYIEEEVHPLFLHT